MLTSGAAVTVAPYYCMMRPTADAVCTIEKSPTESKVILFYIFRVEKVGKSARSVGRWGLWMLLSAHLFPTPKR